MPLRNLRRRLRAGRLCRTDFLYLLVCLCAFLFLASQFGGNPYSDAKAIPPKQQDRPQLQPQYNLQQEEFAPLPPAPNAEIKVTMQRRELAPPVQQSRSHASGQIVSSGSRKKSGGEHSSSIRIDGESYPKLAASGKFVPMRRIVHLDLKGAPPKRAVFTEIFYLLKRLRATGVLLEWEDMFPFEGILKDAVNGNAYSMEEVEEILAEARKQQLEVIPLVQTFAHLEWILKLKEYAYLRDHQGMPQVICVGKEEAFSLIKEMIDEVAKVHARYGMNFFHIGADEVFNMGFCNETQKMISEKGSKDLLTLFHIARTAEYVKETYKVTPLAWHDMFAHSPASDLQLFRLPELLEPVLWSYAEDLNSFLPYNTWEALAPFPRVWGSSAWKGADGPMRFHSNPIHYIRNHESWTKQFTKVYNNFEIVQGLIMTGWSRYDHMAGLAETFPIGIPSLAMSMETVIEAKPMQGRYPFTTSVLKCAPPVDQTFVYGCEFPGRKVYELVNSFMQSKRQLKHYAETDYELNGWLSTGFAEKYSYSSAMYLQKIEPFLDYYRTPLERLVKDLRREMTEIFYDDAVDEFLETYIEEDLMFLRRKEEAVTKILARTSFEKRPFVQRREDL